MIFTVYILGRSIIFSCNKVSRNVILPLGGGGGIFQ